MRGQVGVRVVLRAFDSWWCRTEKAWYLKKKKKMMMMMMRKRKDE